MYTQKPKFRFKPEYLPKVFLFLSLSKQFCTLQTMHSVYVNLAFAWIKTLLQSLYIPCNDLNLHYYAKLIFVMICLHTREFQQ